MEQLGTEQATMTTSERLSALVEELYASWGRLLIPRPPYVLVRVLPKDIKVGRFYLPPGKDQNKPVFEGLVLAVYRPYWRPGAAEDESKIFCTLRPGDHVLFQHYQGIPAYPVPIDGYGGDYRLIQETAIPAVLEYDRPKVETQLHAILRKYEGDEYLLYTREILERFNVVPRKVSGKTI